MAQLELSVVLNLANFRTQLGKLAQASAAYYYPVNLTIDKQAFKKQLAALGNIKPVIKIDDSQLDAARKRIGTLNKSLATLRRATSTPIEIKLKYVEVGKPASAAAGQIGRAVSGGVRGSQALEGVGRSELLNIRKMMSEAGMALGKITSLSKATASELRASIVPAFTNSGEQAINGLAIGLKDSSSKIGKTAGKVGIEAVNGIKAALGIASPSRVFKQIGEFSVDGLELGFLNGLKDFKTKAVAEIKSIVKSLRQEARVGMIAAGGLLSPVAGPRTASTRTIPGVSSPRDVVSNQDPGRSNNRILNSLSLLTGDPKLYRSRMANLGANRLPSSLLGSAATQMNLEEIAPSFKEARLGGTKTGVANIIDEAFFGRGTLPKASNALNALSNTIERLASSARAAAPSGILQSASGNPRFRAFGGVPSGQSMGIFPPTAQPTAYPPSGGFLEFSRRATAISAGLPGNVFGGRQPPGGPPSVSPGGPPSVPPVPPRGGGGGSFGGMQFNVPKLPGAGLVREIGTEFGFAAKQVLLFGTAYKALAFIQGFPAQVGAAVGALQSFRNTIKEISPSAEEAAASSQFILDVVDKYNTPIQSARDGFTKLYASMKPTGFSGNEIRDLFLGISQAAATFGMSAEKVDRVNYAFAQMASKGQVMSEELKGQLGDVLPGAMGIFAEAAGFTGPDAITKFSKALEDGVYKGAAMKTLLTSVGVIMRKEFGPGAEGAARTFQGVINRMQNSFKFLYESFEPVAVGFLNSVVMPMTSGIKTLTDGFNAFFTGTLAKTEGGAAFAQVLDSLKPSFEGIRANLTALIPSFQTFGKLLLSVTQFLVTLAGNPITGFLLKVYANVLLVNTAFTLLGGRILLGLITNINAAIIRFVAFGYAINAVGIQTTGANTALAGTQLQMMLLQRNAGAALAPVNALLGSLARIAAIGTIAVVLTIAISNMNELRDAEARLNRLRGARAESVVGPTGPRPIQTAQARFAGASRETIEEARGKQTKYLTDLTLKRQALERKLQTAQGENLAAMADANSASITTAGNRLAVAQANLASINQDIKNAQEVLRLDPRNYRRQAEINKVSTPGMSVTSGGGGGAAGAKPKEKKERESQVPQLMLQLEKTKELSAVEMQIVNAQLMNNTSQLSSLELLKRLIEFKYEAKSLALEDLTTEERALKYKEIGLRREQAIFENQLQLQIDLKKERDEIQQGFAATLAGYQEEANFQQMYLDLINQGVLPSLAKVRVEAEKAFAEGEKKLDQSIEQIQLNIASLELTIEALKLEKNLTPEKQKQLEADEKRLEILKEDLRLRGLLKDTAPERRGAAVAAGERAVAPKTASEYIGEGLEAAQDRLAQLTNAGYQLVQAANAIGDAFGEAFKGVITGSMTAREALAGFFQNIANYFADMVAQMIAEYLKMQLIKGVLSLLNIFAPGGDPGGKAVGTGQGIFTAANGGIATGGFRAFANGGIVTGPTLGLVGEGRYNEAVIPLPDGKSVPVDLGGMAGGMGGEVTSNIVVNINNGQMQGNGNSNGSELGRKIEGAVKQVLVSELRPGGILSSGRR
jgi:tape measure domain-containing protein